MNARVRVTRSSEAKWNAANPIVDAGDIAIVMDENGEPVAMKIGNGRLRIVDLPAYGLGGSLAGNAVVDGGTFN